MSNSKDSKGIAKAALSVVNITASNNIAPRNYGNRGNDAVAGSGILISDDGYIITNLHVVSGKGNIAVELEDGQVKIAKIIGYDQRSDLAVIKILSPEKLIPITWADSKNAQVGDEVIAIGNAFGLGKTFTSGIISATGRDYGNPYLELIQTDAAINPGNSGGALLNHRGNLVGMSTKIFSNKLNLLGLNKKELEKFFISIDEKPFRAKQIIKWVHQRGVSDFSEMTDISKDLRTKLETVCVIEAPEVIYEKTSQDGTKKWVISVGTVSYTHLTLPTIYSV